MLKTLYHAVFYEFSTGVFDRVSESVLKSLMSFRKAVDIRVDNCRKLKNNQTYNGLSGFKQALADVSQALADRYSGAISFLA